MSSSDTIDFTINVTMQKRWTPHFLSMLRAMQNYGAIGSSRHICIYSDGDGDFRPRFDWPDNIADEAAPFKNIGGDLIFDAG
jgi:hypothetical protein